MASIARISKETGLTHPTVTSAIGHLERLKIVRPANEAKYGRLYAYDRYLEILNAESWSLGTARRFGCQALLPTSLAHGRRCARWQWWSC